MREEERCGSCWFSRATGELDKVQCRHELPLTVQMQMQQTTMIDHGRRPGPASMGLQVIAFWPTVNAAEWCGKYRPRVTARDRVGSFLLGLVGR